jgi:hypothetical protein
MSQDTASPTSITGKKAFRSINSLVTHEGNVMETETRYRFFVREKPEPQHEQEVARRIFVTSYYFTEEQAQERYEVIERLEHSASVVDASGYLRKAA